MQILKLVNSIENLAKYSHSNSIRIKEFQESNGSNLFSSNNLFKVNKNYSQKKINSNHYKKQFKIAEKLKIAERAIDGKSP